MSTTTKTPREIEIRKLRKKLRQIENLERLDRDLLEDEVIKVLKKDAIREQLRKLLIEEAEKQAKIEAREAREAREALAKEEGKVKTEKTFVRTSKPDTPGSIKLNEDDSPPSYNEIVSSKQIPGQKQKGNNVSQKNTKEEKSPSKEQELDPDATLKDLSKKDQAKKDSSKRKQIKKSWNRSQFIVYDLEGHNDLVTDIDSNDKILVTASRDTTIRSWSLKTFEELHIFGGHSGGVTSLKLLNAAESQKIGQCLFGNNTNSLYMLSGSLDCSFKIWQVESGKMMKSVYTYNPVTQITYFNKAEMFLTASDGGKLELWNGKSLENIYSDRIYDGSLTGLQVEDDCIYTSSSDGVLKLHQWRNKKLFCLYKSENLRMADMRLVSQRNIRCLGVSNQTIYYGDGGINIKVVNWKKGIVHKLLNHTEDFGVTDAVCCNEDSIFTSAYDLDNGLAYINVRTLPDAEYVATLNDEATGQIKYIHCCRGSISTGDLLLAVGGLELKIWKLIASSRIPEDLSVVPARYLPKLSMTGADSGTESEYTDDDDDDEEEKDESDLESQNKFDLTDSNNSGWFASCTLL